MNSHITGIFLPSLSHCYDKEKPIPGSLNPIDIGILWDDDCHRSVEQVTAGPSRLFLYGVYDYTCTYSVARDTKAQGAIERVYTFEQSAHS
jgi:hypothetical protein